MLSAILPALHRWHQMELRSHVAARRSPTSPEQRSKWRVRIGGWRWPKAWQQSPSPHSLAHLPLLAYFYAAFVAMFPTTGSSEEATSGRWRTNAEKLARALLSFAKQMWVCSHHNLQSVYHVALSNTFWGLVMCYMCTALWILGAEE